MVAIILVVSMVTCIRVWSSYQLTCAAEQSVPPKLELYLRMGADVNSRVYKGLSALDMAAYAGKKENVMLLLKRGANPASALRTALITKNYDIAEILISRGARRNDVPTSVLEELKQAPSSQAKQIYERLNRF